GQPAPGGGNFTTDFEPSAINDSGTVAFTADTKTNADEGVFIDQGGSISQLIRAGLPTPGGSTFALGESELGRLALNDGGDVGAGFGLKPPNLTGLPGGIYRYSHQSGVLSAVLEPGTPAPGGGTFEGTLYNIGLNNRGDMVFPGLATGSAIGT